MKPSEILEQYGWTQGAYARDSFGITTKWGDPDAICFCAVGAIRRSRSAEKAEAFIFRESILAIGFPSIPAWNDAPGRTKEDVIAALKACGL